MLSRKLKQITIFHSKHLMSLCSGAIIVNSSFSWWGAWLQNNRGKVIAPDTWFGPNAADLDTSDVRPDRWEILEY